MDNLAKENQARPALEPEPPSKAVAANENAAPKGVAANRNAAPPSTLPKYCKSAGDYLFDIGVYGGIGYIANAAISLTSDRYATQLKQGFMYDWGKKVEKGFTHAFKPFMKLATAEKAAAKGNQIFFLGLGGWALLLPMKWLKDRKVGIIQGTDQLLGTGPKTAEAKEAQMHALDDGPRQSMGSLFSGRVVSYLTTIGASLPFITSVTPIGENFSLFLDKNLGPHLPESFKKPLTKPLNRSGKVIPTFTEALGMEIILAGTAAGLHYGSSKFIANHSHKQAANSAATPETRIEATTTQAATTLNEPTEPQRSHAK